MQRLSGAIFGRTDETEHGRADRAFDVPAAPAPEQPGMSVEHVVPRQRLMEHAEHIRHVWPRVCHLVKPIIINDDEARGIVKNSLELLLAVDGRVFGEQVQAERKSSRRRRAACVINPQKSTEYIDVVGAPQAGCHGRANGRGPVSPVGDSFNMPAPKHFRGGIELAISSLVSASFSQSSALTSLHGSWLSIPAKTPGCRRQFRHPRPGIWEPLDFC